MLKLHHHFARSSAIIFVIALICAAFVSYISLRDIQKKSLEDKLKSTIKLIKLQMPLTKNSDDLNTFAKAVNKAINIRVTFVSEEGKVLGESDYVDITKMDNHQFRPEILDATENEFGVDFRYSDTLKSNFLYVANEFEYGGELIFIRLSISTEDIRKSFLGLWRSMLSIFLVAFLISFVVGYLVSRRVDFEIQKLMNGLKNIANKEYNTRISASFAKEFLDIASLVHELAEKLSKRDKQKRKHAAKLRLVNQQRTEIISAISHEFKNPVAAIIGYAQTLLEDGDANPTIRERFLNKIVSNGDKITDMINRLSLSTKLENNDLTPRFSKFDLSLLAQDVVEQFRTTYPNRTFKAELESSIVKADSTIIEMVLNNLLENAVKYSEVDIVIKVKDKRCEIIDQGEGIDEDEIKQVTKKFYRSNRLTWDNSMGIGLSLVTYMLKLHNSKLKIDSKLGVGSTFSFVLE